MGCPYKININDRVRLVHAPEDVWIVVAKDCGGEFIITRKETRKEVVNKTVSRSDIRKIPYPL